MNEPIQLSPKIVLVKHMALDSRMTVVLSATATGIVVDFSAPGTFGDLAILHRVMGMEIDKMLRGTETATPPTENNG